MLVHEMGEQHSGRSISFQEMLLIYIYMLNCYMIWSYTMLYPQISDYTRVSGVLKPLSTENQAGGGTG